jgi:hypothetical protein
MNDYPLRVKLESASPPEQPQLTDQMVKVGAEAMIASDTPDGPAYTTLARACLSAALGVNGYVAPEKPAAAQEALRLLRKISDLAYDEDVGEPLDCAIDYANKAIAALTAQPDKET